MSRLWAGIDLGGTSIKAGIANEAGELLIQDSIPTESHAGPRTVLDRCAALIERLRSQLVATEEFGGLGMGVPGLVDISNGTTRFLPNMPTHWRDVPVATVLRERLGCPVHLLNDVRTATLGELRFGHGRDRNGITLAFIAIGTGVGGGIVVDGRLRLGPFGAAGEVGHQTIIPDGPRCGCGNRGCLEALASGPAISADGIRLMQMGLAPELHRIVGGDSGKVTPREMHAAAEAGDEKILEVLKFAGGYIGIAAANIVTMVHPELIVLGGGVAGLGDVLVNTVRDVITQRVGMVPATSVQVERTLLGSQAGLWGAIALAQSPPTVPA